MIFNLDFNELKDLNFLYTIFNSAIINSFYLSIQNNFLTQFPSNLLTPSQASLIVLEASSNSNMIGCISKNLLLSSLFTYINVENNQLMKNSNESGIDWNFNTNSVAYAFETFTCFNGIPIDTTPGVELLLKFTLDYFNYSNCQCRSNFFGIAPNDCKDCGKNIDDKCPGILSNYGQCNGDSLALFRDYYPQIVEDRICFSKCKIDGICNPNGDCQILSNYNM